MKSGIMSMLLFLLTGHLKAQDLYPNIEIENQELKVIAYIPDVNHGYYRATRFDWSGVIGSLKYRGHEYFDPWLPAHNPTVHESITGPVEGFAPIGFDEAKPGDHFLTIGVGILRKPDEKDYHFSNTYEIVNAGEWKVRNKRDRIDFKQTLNSEIGYGYSYNKTLRLVKDQPKLRLENKLTNTGSKTIETTVFNHNFFVIDREPTGPNIVTRFPYPIHAEGRGFGDAIIAQDSTLIFTRYLEKGQSVYTADVQGYEDKVEDYSIRVENKKTGAGVLITSDQAIHKLPYWACATTACPEPYIKIKVQPGKSFNWMTEYTFYTFPVE